MDYHVLSPLLSWPWSFFGCNIPNTADVLSVITNNWSWESNGKTLTGFCQRNIVCPNSMRECGEVLFFLRLSEKYCRRPLHGSACTQTGATVHPNLHLLTKTSHTILRHLQLRPLCPTSCPNLTQIFFICKTKLIVVWPEKKNKTILWPEFCRRLLSGSKSLAGRLIWLVGDISLTDGQRVEWEMAIYCDILNPKNGWQAHVCG